MHLMLLQQIHPSRDEGIVRSRQNRESYNLNIFLKRGIDDHLRSLSQAGINNFHARIAESPCNHLGAPVMPVKPRLRHQHAYFRLGTHQSHLTTEDAGSTAVPDFGWG